MIVLGLWKDPNGKRACSKQHWEEVEVRRGGTSNIPLLYVDAIFTKSEYDIISAPFVPGVRRDMQYRDDQWNWSILSSFTTRL